MAVVFMNRIFLLKLSLFAACLCGLLFIFFKVVDNGNDRERPPLFVHLLAYQRTGSSMTGGLFSSNPDVFYLFEPLDMVYSSMYGTIPGLAGPVDIFNYKDTIRLPSDDELKSIVWFTDQIYNCRLSSLPIPALTHIFWSTFYTSSTVSDYSLCLHSRGLTITHGRLHDRCRKELKGYCSKHFDPEFMTFSKCRDALYSNSTWWSTEKQLSAIFNGDDGIVAKFAKYFQCFREIEVAVKFCAAKYLDNKCKKSSVRVIKTVRGGMELGEILLNKYPNYKLLHLVRDPRGVTRSRAANPWTWGVREGSGGRYKTAAVKWSGSNKELNKLARGYCLKATEDMRRRRELSLIHPGKSNRIVYDVVVDNFYFNAKKIYSFLGLEPPPQTITFVEETDISSKGGNTTHKPDRWRTYFTSEQVSIIEHECIEFYREIVT